jgi:hypothetical protein
VTSDTAVVATFKAIEVVIPTYFVTATANDPIMGIVEGAGEYEEGATAILTATPVAGYKFLYWTIGDQVLTDNPLTLTVDKEMEVEATFIHDIATDVDNIEGNTVKIEKVLRDGHVYILVNDQIYSISGKRVEK